MPVQHMTDATLRSIAKTHPDTGVQTDYHDDPARSGVRGLLLKHSYGGTLTWYLMYYPKGQGSKQQKLGRYPGLTLANARIEALALQEALRKDPDHLGKIKRAEADVQTFAIVAEKFKRLYIEKNGLRTGRVMWQQIEKHLMPSFRNVEFATIKRRTLMELLDKIEAENGASMADSVLAVFRSMATWLTLRDEDYRSPLVKGMKRYKSHPRKRALETDDEIKTFWVATEDLETYGALARVCLLLGQRRAPVARMKWTDIKDGVWTLGHAPREKPNCGAIKLPPFVLAIVEAQPRLAKNPFVFPALRGQGRQFNSFGQYALLLTKREQEITPDMQPHTVHDLRRSFSSVCPRLGIDREIRERCLGHVIGTPIERTYDRYPYLNEMGVAFATFARHVQNVITPPPQNVVRLDRGRGTGRRARSPVTGTP